MNKEKSYFEILNRIETQIQKIESRLDKLEETFNNSLSVTRMHLVQVKNRNPIADAAIFEGAKYSDLTSEKAYAIFQDPDQDFVLLDVSDNKFTPKQQLKNARKISLDELAIRHTELKNKLVRYLVISEDGTKSILACEILHRLGYHNLFNISGGYRFWPGAGKLDMVS
jgi:rhodanese-related sulfurtransferase